jgi:putative phosphoesterase
MRVAFISDIHANLTALNAVLADIRAQEVDQIISLGDTVTLGPQPSETLATLRQLGCIYIKGNHDEALLDPGHELRYQVTEHLVPDIQWCRERLSSSDLEFIESFLPTYDLTFPNGISVLCYHGSPRSTTDLILSTTSAKMLDRHFGGHPANAFIGGHTHIQMQRRHGEKLILNAGSVGNTFAHAYKPGNTPSLLPWAEYAILGQEGDSLDADLRRVYFDTAGLLEIVSKSGLPGAEWWLRQYKKQYAAA